ncbi:MAG: hypothetical protein AAB611_02750 [Patescibacteria group bacterium]
MEALHTSSEKQKEQHIQRQDDFSIPRNSHEEILESRAIVEKRDLRKMRPESVHTNAVYFVSLDNDGSGIFKPKLDRDAAKATEELGIYPKRARAAYLISSFFELDIVPPTVIREIDNRIGSLQKYISGGRDFYEFADISQEELLKKLQRQFAALWLFDYIIWNSDREFGRNIIISADKVHAIDNDYSFIEDREPGQFESFLYTPLPPPPRFVEKISDFAKNKKAQDSLRKALEELLPSDWVEACIERILFLSQELEQNSGVVSKLDTWYPKTK